MLHPLPEHPLPGIGPGRLKRLHDAGIDSLEALVEADLEALEGIPQAVLRRAVEEARRRLDAEAPAVAVEVAGGSRPTATTSTRSVIPFREEAPAEGDESRHARRMARGLEAARRIEHTVELLRNARSHARRSSSTRRRRRARWQFKRLLIVLDELQQAVIAGGISGSASRQLASQLEPLDVALEAFLARAPKRRRLVRIRKVAKAARRSISASVRA